MFLRLLICCLFLVSPAAAYTKLSKKYSKSVEVDLIKYFECAKINVYKIGAKQPNSFFEDHESLLPNLCGVHIRSALKKLTKSTSSRIAKNIVNSEYAFQRKRLVRAYYHAQVRERIEVERHLTMNANKKAKEASQALKEYRSCISDKMTDFLAYSQENAEIGADVILLRCSPHHEKYVTAIKEQENGNFALAKRSGDSLKADARKRLIAAIVTGRVEYKKRARGSNAPMPLNKL